MQKGSGDSGRVCERAEKKMSEYITTYTGKHFKPTEPDPELFDIADIAVPDLQRKWSCEDVLVGRGTLHLLCKRGKGERSVG